MHGGVTLEAGHPTAEAFFEAAAALCTPKRTRCLCAFEVRARPLQGQGVRRGCTLPEGGRYPGRREQEKLVHRGLSKRDETLPFGLSAV